MKIVVLGLSLSSSWGNGHATTYRALLRALAARGHSILFLERDVAWYAAHRDLPAPGFCQLGLYPDLPALNDWRAHIADADAIIIGSYVPDGIAAADWVFAHARGIVAFYDIDTPITLAALERGEETYISPQQIPRFDAYFSFTGGPTLERLRTRFGARRAHALFCSVDPGQYFPQTMQKRWDLSYLGTYSADRQPGLDRLLLEPARRLPHLKFAVAGPQYPDTIVWPANVERLDHLPPADHAAFYNASRYTLNITRADMIAAGFSPSVRLFEAGACAASIISDPWPGLSSIFTHAEISIAHTTADVLQVLAETEQTRSDRAAACHRRILASHTANHRAAELESALDRLRGDLSQSSPHAPHLEEHAPPSAQPRQPVLG
jgi:spore maturation protein CgeB